MSELSDEALAAAAQGGDAAASEQLLRRYKNSVRGVARSFFLEGGDAEELIQEGMIGLYRAVTDFRSGGMSFKNFAYLCIRRSIVSAVRAAARKKHSPLNKGVPLPETDEAGGADPEEIAIGSEEASEFFELLQRELTPAEYGALTAYMEGLSMGEIAEQQGVSPKSAENAVQRAKNKVARHFGIARGKGE